MITPQQKRRNRERTIKEAQLAKRRLDEMVEAANHAREEGRVAGMQQGARIIRNGVLYHAAELFKEGKDDAAFAVRDVYRKLPESV